MINGLDSPTWMWIFLVAQFFGVSIAGMARLSEGSSCQSVSQCLFFLALPMMGIITAFALAIGSDWWLACSTTLAIMVLTVTCDFRGSREAATW